MMIRHDEPNCLCCPEPVKLGIKAQLVVVANDHGHEDLCVILFHRLAFAYSLIGLNPTAYFVFNKQYSLLKS